jgi:lysophospholipase L1-like esterase
MLRLILAVVTWFALVPGVAAAQVVVAGFGDSITSLDFDSFPDGSYLAYLDPSWTIVEQAFPGDESGYIHDQLDSWLTSNTADAIVVIAGTVDASHRHGYSESTTVSNIESMIDLCQNAGIPVVVGAPPPVEAPCDGAARGPFSCADFDQRLADLSVALAALTSQRQVPFADLYQAFVDASGGPGSLLLSDGVHPNLDGDLEIAIQVEPLLLEILDPDPPGPPFPQQDVPSLGPAGLALLGVALALAGAWVTRRPPAAARVGL